VRDRCRLVGPASALGIARVLSGYGAGVARQQTAGMAGVVGALGVVFGDIGTSPLYAMRSVLSEGGDLNRGTVYGLTSMVIWSVLLVVTGLYVSLLMRVDNHGEGGLLALFGVLRGGAPRGRIAAAATFVAMVGAGMFLGDSVITPAISVLSAAEGLEVADASLSSVVLPVALTILMGVFLLQRIGSGGIGRLYGPVMIVWFSLLAVTGGVSLARDPQTLASISPYYAVAFAVNDPLTTFVALGSVILAVTGAEALYADLGHFGRAAITRAWLGLVLPALLLAYLGEAAQVLRDPSSAEDPFYAVVPSWATVPVLVVATAATVIASEAVIAGGFTVLHQAGGLGLFPYLRTRHTSTEQAGQIYLPAVNWAMAAAVLAVVLIFRSSERLASAYGLAVSLTILTTTTLYVTLMVLREHDRLRATAGVVLGGVMACFFAAAVPKFVTGGWLPTLIGGVLFVVMWTWWSGRARLAQARHRVELSSSDFVRDLHQNEPARVPGTAVFLTDDVAIAPMALHTVLELCRLLPERALILSWRLADTPTARPHASRFRVGDFGAPYDGVVSVDVTLGYRERLDVVAVLRDVAGQNSELADLNPDTAYYFVSIPHPQLSSSSPMARWRQRLFLLLDELSTDRIVQLRLPRHRTVTVGRELDL
jgi:KUP system potassium uptake protein